MSEHTPLTEAERESLAKALGCEFHDADYGECSACAGHAEQVWDDAIERIFAARTSTATTDTGQTCWGEDCDQLGSIKSEQYGGLVCPHHADAATADTGLRERVEALADDLWRVAPCGCGHRADLHTMGGLDGVSVCTGGLGICGCDWSFVRIVQQRIRDLLATPASTEDRADNEAGDCWPGHDR